MMFMYILTLVISISLCVLPAIQVVRKAGLLSIVFTMPCFSLISKGISSITLDLGTYVSELGLITWNNYSAPIYFLLLAVFFSFLNYFVGRQLQYVGDKTPISASIEGPSILASLIPLAGIVMAMYLIVDMAISGIPLFSNNVITRFNYWEDYSRLPQAELVSNFVTVVSVALGLLYASSSLTKKRSDRYIALIVTFLIVRFLLGYKVSGILDIIIGFTTGYLLRRYSISGVSANSFAKAMKLILLICTFGVCSYIVWQIASGSASSLGEAIDLLIDRQFSLSSHMWWSVIGDLDRSSELFPNNLAELLSIVQGKTELSTDIGVYGMMAMYAPDAVFFNYVANGVRFGACFITVNLFYNGWIVTILFIILNSYILSVFFRVFLNDARANRIVSFALLYRVFLIFTSYLTASGTLVTFYRPNVLILVLLYVACRLLENQFNASIGKSGRSMIKGRNRRWSLS